MQFSVRCGHNLNLQAAVFLVSLSSRLPTSSNQSRQETSAPTATRSLAARAKGSSGLGAVRRRLFSQCFANRPTPTTCQATGKVVTSTTSPFPIVCLTAFGGSSSLTTLMRSLSWRSSAERGLPRKPQHKRPPTKRNSRSLVGSCFYTKTRSISFIIFPILPQSKVLSLSTRGSNI
jgi:hypothetical protein